MHFSCTFGRRLNTAINSAGTIILTPSRITVRIIIIPIKCIILSFLAGLPASLVFFAQKARCGKAGRGVIPRELPPLTVFA